MKKVVLIIYSLFLLFVTSTSQNRIIENSLLHGYSIGDSISKDFNYTRRFGPYFGEVKYKNDTRLRVFTTCNYISSFYLELDKIEYEKSLEILKKQLGTPFLHYIGDTLHGLQLNHQIEYYSWIDKNKYTNYCACLNLNKNNKGVINITNDTINENLNKRFLKDYNKQEIEFLEVEFEK